MVHHNLPEEFETGVSLVGLGEVGDGGIATGRTRLVQGVREGEAGKGTYGQERTETRAIPMMRAYLIRKAMRNAVTMPPQNRPTHNYSLSVVLNTQKHRPRVHTLGFVISPPSHIPVASSIMSAGHPASARGVALYPPVIAPMPAEYERPISVRRKPIPTPVAVLIVAGMSLTSHWRMPVRARKMKTMPSKKTAVRARRYGMGPLPL